MRISYVIALGAAMLAVSGCNNNDGNGSGSDEIEPALAPDNPAPTPDDDATTSILRPDIGQVEPTDAPIVVLDPLEVTIGFPDGGSQLDDDAQTALREALQSAQMEEGGAITLRGHSDAGGSDAANMRASRQRAEAVRDWLIENDVSEDRIEVIAFGEQNPIRPNARPDGTPNEGGRAANRRVDMVIDVENDEDAEEPADTSTAAPKN
ncbi:MAG: OmpA family protein [Erythrobacter sp.]